MSFNYNLTNHDWSISLLDTERWLFNIQLERIDRLKHSPALNDWYHGKLRDFLNQKELWNYYTKEYFQETLKYIRWVYNFKEYDEIYLINKPVDLDKTEIFWTDKVNVKIYNKIAHHLFHAMSTFYASEFDEATVIVFDFNWIVKEGSDFWKAKDLMAMQSIYHFKWNDYKLLFYTPFSNKNKKYGIWITYDLFSSFIGLEEGSVMWLSAYGNSRKYEHINIYEYHENWDILLNKVFLEWLDLNKLNNNWLWFDEVVIKNIHKKFWVTMHDVVNARKNIENSFLADIAAKLQKDTENAVVFLAKKAYELTWCKNLCLAWWVALNILANKAILEKTKFKNIFVQPAANDAWLTVWQNYFFYHCVHKNKKRFPFIKVWYGKVYSDLEIEWVIQKYENYLSYNKSSDIINDTVNILLSNSIIWFFQWWVEYWPRALGNRSILALPIRENKDKVNKIKERQLWRPLAPVVLEQFVNTYFEASHPSSFMTLAADVKEITKKIASGIVHVDGTARYQTVNSKNNKVLYKILLSLYDKGIAPILINTSLNWRGEPIIENPEDAIRFFLSTELDYMIIWNFILTKEKVFKKFKYKNHLNKIHKLLKNNAELKKEIISLNATYRKIAEKIGNILFGEKVNFEVNDNTFEVMFSYTIGNNKNEVILGFGRLEWDLEKFYSVSYLTIWFKKICRFENYVLNNLKENLVYIEKLLLFFIKKLKSVKEQISRKGF